MTGPVVVSPGGVVEVIPPFRNQSFEEVIDVADQARLEFDGRDTGGRPGDEHQNLTFFHAAGGQRPAQSRGQVMNVAVPIRLKNVLGCLGHLSNITVFVYLVGLAIAASYGINLKTMFIKEFWAAAIALVIIAVGTYLLIDRKSKRLNSSHIPLSRIP